MTDETTNVIDLYFRSVKELFAAFDFNPLKDIIIQVTRSTKLNGSAAQFKLNDATDTLCRDCNINNIYRWL